MAWRRRLAKMATGLGIGLAGSACVGFIVVVAIFVFLHTDAGRDLLRRRLEGALSEFATHGKVTVGRLDTDLWNDLALHDVRIVDAEGETVVFVARILADVNLGALPRRIVRVPHLRVDGVHLALSTGDDGVTNLARVFGETPGKVDSGEPFQGLPVTLDLPDVGIHGVQVRYRGPDGTVRLAISGLDVAASVRGRDEIVVDDLDLAGLLAHPGPLAVAARGRVTYAAEGVRVDDLQLDLPRAQATAAGTLGDTWDGHVAIARLDLAHLDPILGGAGLTGTWSADLDLGGAAGQPTIAGTLHGVEGTLGDATIDLTLHPSEDPFRLTGGIQVADFHVHHLVPDIEQPVVVNGGGPLEVIAGDWPEALVVDLRFAGGEQRAYGQEADAVDGHARIERGVLHLDGVHLLGIAGDLGIDGTLDLDQGPMRLGVRGRLLPDYLSDLGIEAIRSSGVADVVVEGDIHRVDAVPITVRGTVAFAPFVTSSEVRFAEVAARVAVQVVDGDLVEGTAVVTAREGRTFGVEVGTVTLPALDIHLPLGDGDPTFQGAVLADDVVMDGIFSARSVRGPVQVQVPSEGDLTVDARLDLDALDILGFPGTSGHLDATLAGDLARFDLAANDAGRALLVTAGTWDLGTQRLAVPTFLASPTPRATWRATRPILLTATEGGIADADIALAGELGAFTLRGTVGTVGLLDAEVHVDDLQLDAFAELYPDRVSGLSGVLDLEATFAGRASNPEITTAVDLRGLWVEDTVRWLDATGEVTVAEGVLSPRLKMAVAGDPWAILWGALPVHADLSGPRMDPSRPVDLAVAVQPGPLARIGNLSPALDDVLLPEGQLSAVLEASGLLRDPAFRVAGVAEIPVDAWTEPTRFEFDLRRDAADLAFWADFREGFVQRGSLAGFGSTRMEEVFAWAFGDAAEPDLANAELWLNDMLVSGVLLGLPVADLAAALDAEVAVSGELTGGFTATGSPYTPRLDVNLDWEKGRLGDVALESAYARLTDSADGYVLDALLDFLDDGSVAVQGAVPIDIDLREPVETWTAGPLDVAVSGPGVPLEALAAVAPGFRNADGLLVLGGAVRGTIGAPEPDLTAHLTDATLEYTPLGLRFRDIALDLAIDPKMVRLRTFRTHTEPIRRRGLSGLDDLGSGGSLVAATGSARLVDWAPSALSVRMQLTDDAWVAATSDTRLRLNGALLATGEWPALSVTGDLEVASGQVLIDTASFLDAAPLGLDPALVVHREGVAPIVRTAPGPSIFDAFTADVDVAVSRTLTLDLVMPWIDELGQLGQNVTQLQIGTRLGGEVEARLAHGNVVLVGEVNVVEGRASVLRSTFETLEGSVIYAGSEPGNPDLDLRAEMSLPEATIAMRIGGTAERPDISFSSDAYPDETQILAILITGRAPDQLTEEEGQATVQSLAGLLLNSLLSGPSLGNFTIDPEGAVEVGVPVSSRVYATTRLAPTAPFDENLIALELEWSLGRRLVLSLGLGNVTLWGDLFYEIRF